MDLSRAVYMAPKCLVENYSNRCPRRDAGSEMFYKALEMQTFGIKLSLSHLLLFVTLDPWLVQVLLVTLDPGLVQVLFVSLDRCLVRVLLVTMDT